MIFTKKRHPIRLLFAAFGVLFISFIRVPVASAVVQHFELYGAKSNEDLVQLQRWGFDQVILEDNALIDQANALGMRVVQANWWHVDSAFGDMTLRTLDNISLS